MLNELPGEALELRSLIKEDGKLEVTLATVPVPTPGDDEVLIRVEATPINPSDLGLLFGGADITTVTSDGAMATAKLPPQVLTAMAGRVGESMPVGNEGAGPVVAAGSSPEAQALLGKTVAIIGGSMYAQYRLIKAAQCLVLPEGTTPAEGASCFVNPLTALGMVETMKLEGHTGLVHTAAASNLGQMLVKLCIADGIPLVNVVRRQEQVDLLKGIGATHVVNMTAPTFMEDLTEALVETGATLAFDAIGGGRQGGQILAAMEAAAVRKMSEYSRYGSTTYKQLYIYGGLDRSPTEFQRAFGMMWGMGGWLLTPFLQKIGPEAAQALRDRVAREVKTTFASSYTQEVPLKDMLKAEHIAVYGKQSTGAKYLVRPHA